MFRRFLVVPVLLFLLVTGCEEEYLVPSSSLDVLVTADAEPVAGVPIQLLPRDSTFDIKWGETSDAGVIRFAPLHAGTYELEFFWHEEVVCEQNQVVQVPAWTDMQHPITCWDKTPTLLLLPGYLEFEQDTVRMSFGEHLFMYYGVLPDPYPGFVYVRYTSLLPMVFPCTDVPSTIKDMDPPSCGGMADRVVRPDTPIIVTEDMMPAIARVMPCAKGPDGAPLTPEAWVSSGMFSECAAWGTATTEAGPGLEVLDAWRMKAVGCGQSWVTKTERDGWRRPWPEPFDGYARIEVEISC